MSTTTTEPQRSSQKSRTITSKSDCVGLVSRGVPSSQPLLRASATWTQDAQSPVVNGAPHFVATGGAQTLHLFLGSRGWQIAPDLDSSVAYAIAPGVTAAHPNTVRQGEWQLPTEPNGGWAAHNEFHVSAEGPNSEAHPFRIDDIGADFFMRVKTTKLVWFIDPTTGEVVHSGAKNAGVRARPGKRYCPLCTTCFSANNFVSQHVKNLHTPPPPSAPAVLVDGDAGALLYWKVECCPAGAMPVAFAVQYSDDNGHSWQVAIANTGSADPRARIAALQLGRAYLFRVAIIGLAATGAYSPPSQPFFAVAGAPPANVALLDTAPAQPAAPSSAPPAPPAAADFRASPLEVVAKMNASLVQLTPQPHETAALVVAPVATPVVVAQAARPSPVRAELLLPERLHTQRSDVSDFYERSSTSGLPSLKRKASFADSLTPALAEYLDLEIDKVLAESSADFGYAELIGDRVELKLSIPVPKGLGASTPTASADDCPRELQPPPAKRQKSDEASSLEPPPPLSTPATPPLSPLSAPVPSLLALGEIPSTAKEVGMMGMMMMPVHSHASSRASSHGVEMPVPPVSPLF